MYRRKKHRLLWLLLILCLGGGLLAIRHHDPLPFGQNSQSQQVVNDSNLANLNYQSGQSAVVTINHNQPTLNMNDWQTNRVKYQPLDNLNRTSAMTVAYLQPNNVANDNLRVRQTVIPTGWHQKFNAQHQPILNRGHIIAYSLSKGISLAGNYDPSKPSGDQNNPKNLFTQTAFCNQELQTIYESKVRHALEAGAKVVYAVQPIFRGNELMARGVHLQALASNGMHFNVYLFNVQPGYQFNYLTGTSIIDPTMKVPTPLGAPHFRN